METDFTLLRKSGWACSFHSGDNSKIESEWPEIYVHCVVPGNIHTVASHEKSMKIPREFKKKAHDASSEGVGSNVQTKKPFLEGRYGYF